MLENKTPSGQAQDERAAFEAWRGATTLENYGVEEAFSAGAAFARATLAAAAPLADAPALLEWAISRWRSQVAGRPLINVHRRSLDDAWRQVIRFAGGDPDVLIGPSHDDLLRANGVATGQWVAAPGSSAASAVLAGQEHPAVGALRRLHAAANEIHGELDRQTYDEKRRAEWDVADGHTFSVDITAAHDCALTQAIIVAEAAIAGAPLPERGPDLLSWAVQRWHDEVFHRPVVNVHRRTLDDTWRQVIRFAGGDPDKLLDLPAHDTLRARMTDNEFLAASAERAAQADWLPTAENVNALPEPIRRYVHDLATRCDPAGDMAALALARDQVRQLEASNRMLRDAAQAPVGAVPLLEPGIVESATGAALQVTRYPLTDAGRKALTAAPLSDAPCS